MVFPGVGRWQYRTLCLQMEEVVLVISLVQILFIHWENQFQFMTRNADLCPQCLQLGVSLLESLLEVSH